MKEKLKIIMTSYVALMFMASCKEGDRSAHKDKDQSVQLDELQQITYYPSGKIKTKISFNHSLQRQGQYEEYYEGGQIQLRCNYNHDTLEGPFETFNKNGSIKVKAFIWNGVKVGPSYYYDDSGKLELYNEFDFNNGPYYVLKCDKDQKIIKEEGVAISPVLLIDNRRTDSLPPKPTAEINFFYAEPEGYKNLIQCFLNGNPVKFQRLEEHVGSIQIGVSRHRSYDLKITSTLINGNKSPVASDSIVRTINSF